MIDNRGIIFDAVCDEIQVKNLATAFSKQVKAPIFIGLYGNLGSGKTFFSTHFIHALIPNACVTSPTFTLINSYSIEHIDLWHVDLYRIHTKSDPIFHEILEHTFLGGICLVEWADRMSPILPQNRIDIDFTAEGIHHRKVRIIAPNSFQFAP